MKDKYYHTVQYYETDQMGIVHHSNYIRWFEEARSCLLEAAGFGYRAMEENGIISPVLSVDAQYRSMTHYLDIVEIDMTISSYNGIKMCLEYKICDSKTKEIRCTGHSSHCFLNRDNKPISLKREKPEIDNIIRTLMNYETI